MVCQPRHRNNLFVKILQCLGLYKNKEKLATYKTYQEFQRVGYMIRKAKWTLGGELF
jgi:hypothetical protein